MLGKFVVFLAILCYAYGAKILAIFPIASYSHQIVYQPIWRELSVRGHQVTVMTTDPLEDPSLTNLTEISWKSTYAEMKKIMSQMREPSGPIAMMDLVKAVVFNTLDEQLSHPEVTNIIQNKTEHFDLVIAEWLFTEMAVFSERFKCPLVGLTSLGTFVTAHDTVGNPSHPVYNPDLLFPFSGELSLLDRILSTLYSLYFRYDYKTNVLPTLDRKLQKYFGNDIPSLEVMEKKISLLILNVNFVFYPIRPNVPAVVELGGVGIHVKPRKPLPEVRNNERELRDLQYSFENLQDIQSYLDQSKRGVIYFSLGSNIRSSSISPEKFNIIKETLSELPYDILWKWENDKLPGKPENVKISKWLPQQDILGHPNIKLFITQGGLQSLEEALVNKLPCVGIPFFSEQVNNVLAAARHGFVKVIEFNDLTKVDFKNVVLEVITNPTYKRRAIELADAIADAPMKPVDKAVWWIEYVIRHKGADHLRSAAVDIPWYQYLLLDVMAILLMISSLAMFCFYKILRCSIGYMNKYLGYSAKIKFQ